MEALKINGSMRSKYNNALHAQFNDHMYQIVMHSETGALSVPIAITKQWRAAIDVEIDINREVQASATTALMAEKDAERDNLITYLFEEVRNQCRSPFPAKKEAASKLMIYVDKYMGMQHEANDVETMHIKGFVIDVRAGDNAAYLTELGLTELVTMVETANNDYEALKDSRTSERAAKALPTSLVARRATDNLYDQVCKVIEVSHMLATTAEAKQGLVELVGKMNQFIDETKATYHQIAAAGGEEPVPEPTPEPVPEGDDAAAGGA